MLKFLHLSLVLIAILSFVGRVILSETRPELLKQKAFKIAPHIINGLLLLSGFILVFHGGWLAASYGWIVAKLIALIGFVGLGILTLKSRDSQRWLAFAGAMSCFIYISIVAVTKNPFFLF